MTAIPSTAEVLILGGGISGLAVASRLAALGRERVVVLERAAQVGGMAASVPWQGVPVDPGSHRIHSSFAPAALDWIRGCLGGDLRPQARRGAIRVGDRFLPYPPSLLTLGRAFGLRQSLGFARDLLRARISPRAARRRPLRRLQPLLHPVGQQLEGGAGAAARAASGARVDKPMSESVFGPRARLAWAARPAIRPAERCRPAAATASGCAGSC